MKSLAQDVGGLKKVLSNVKMRGTFGEVQLGALLEQMMSPEQYDANVKTKKSGTEFVEFAIKLPGKDDANSTVYLPIDAKFPKDIYEQYYLSLIHISISLRTRATYFPTSVLSSSDINIFPCNSLNSFSTAAFTVSNSCS